MKCFSVHMRLGVMEGIRLSDPAGGILVIGDSRVPVEGIRRRQYQCLRAVHRKEPVLRVMTADIQWDSWRPEPIFVGPFRTKHALMCGLNSDGRTALVMIGSYGHQFLALDCKGEVPRVIEDEKLRRKKSSVMLVARGAYPLFYRGWENRANVRQRLYRMRERTMLLLESRDPNREDDVLINWDGRSLTMIRCPMIGDIIT